MAKTKKNVVEVKNSNLTANDVNVVTNEKITASEKVAKETETKKEMKKVLHSVAPSLSSLELGKLDYIARIKRYFYRDEPDFSKVLLAYKNSGDSDSEKDFASYSDSSLSLPPAVVALLDDKSKLSLWFGSLPQKTANEISGRARIWFRESGGLTPVSLSDFVAYVNRDCRELLKLYGITQISCDDMTVNGSVVAWYDDNSKGDCTLYAEGLYYRALGSSTADYINSLKTLDTLKRWRLSVALNARKNNGVSYTSLVNYLFNVLSKGTSKDTLLKAVEDSVARLEDEKAKELQNKEKELSIIKDNLISLRSDVSKLCYLIEFYELGLLVNRDTKAKAKDKKLLSDKEL